MVTLQYNSFATLGNQAKLLSQSTGCSKRVTEHAFRFQLHYDELRKTHPDWSVICHQEWGLFLLACLLHTVAYMRWWEWQQIAWRHSHQPNPAERTAPGYPSMRTLLGSTDADLLTMVEQVYWGQYEAALSMLPYWNQEDFLAELHEELGQCIMRAGLQDGMESARSPSRDRRCFHVCSSSRA